jgi:hypothetical protein
MKDDFLAVGIDLDHPASDTKANTDVEKLEALLASERERADRAIAAFEGLARRLEAMAEASRPWWRRLGRAG